jgi:1-hydroxy-2-naphthoate dioxygenase
MSLQTGKSLEAFDRDLAEAGLRGQWQFDHLLERLVGGPRPAGVAHLWRWEDVRAKLREACGVLPESFTARRNVAFMNPGLERGTTHTMVMGMQMLKPGEDAWAHRHTMAAIRFVVTGSPHLYTVVDGEPCAMEENDLVLTPRWTWHDHHHDGDDEVVWVDALDIGLIMSLNAGFYETFGDSCQPVRHNPGESLLTRGGTVRPVWERRKELHAPYRYAWRDVEPVLASMMSLDGSRYDGIVLEYVNPVNGGHTMPTLSCWIQALRPGERTLPHRHTSSSTYHVVRGSGTTVVDGTELHWGPRDCFVIPGWAEHSFANGSGDEEAVLFSVNDIPTFEALGLYHEAPEPSLGVAPWPALPTRA